MTRSTTPGGAASGRSDTKTTNLDRRRETLQARKSAAEATAAKVVSLDEELHTNAVHTREYEAGLQAALDKVAGLKKAIKASNKQRAKLRAARKDARRDDVKARQRADTAEAKYDRAVLADMLRREKARDLSVHGEPKLAAEAKAAGESKAGESKAAESKLGEPPAAQPRVVEPQAVEPVSPAGSSGQGTTSARAGAARSTGRTGTRAGATGQQPPRRGAQAPA